MIRLDLQFYIFNHTFSVRGCFVNYIVLTIMWVILITSLDHLICHLFDDVDSLEIGVVALYKYPFYFKRYSL